MAIAQISQRELRNDSGAVLRRVEAGEVLEVTRRGVPVARLVPLSDDSDLRCIRPATRSIWELDLPWITSGEPSEVTMAAIRDDSPSRDYSLERRSYDLDTFKLWRPVPTPDVPFGYKGRIPVMEQLVVTENIQSFLRGDVVDIHTEAIEAEAKKNGMVTLLQAGVLTALRGETTLEEVNRVI